MPSVATRRSTRVFGVVKGVDGIRVLRSGRRVSLDSGEVRLRRLSDRDDLYSLVKHKSSGSKPYGSTRERVHLKKELHREEADKKGNFTAREIKRVRFGNLGEYGKRKMFGIVYSRKRKRLDEDKVKVCRIRSSRRLRTSCNPVFGVLVDGSCGRSGCFSALFSSLLGYVRRKVTLNVSQLAGFFLSQPINGVFSEHGIHFLRESPSNSRGICKFFGARESVLFSFDFAAVPGFFMYMHYSLLLIAKKQSFVLFDNSRSSIGNLEMLDESDSDDEIGVLEGNNWESHDMLHVPLRSFKLTGRTAQSRSGLNSRSFQKRSSLRRRRGRNSSFRVHKANGASVSDLISSRKNGINVASMVSVKKLRSSSQSKMNNSNSSVLSTKQDRDSLCCFANILVIESDRCCREEGAKIMLEFVSSGEWRIVVKKDGSVRYTHRAQKVMRPCSCNRLTHSVIWMGDGNWKLEFRNRQDWVIFKDIYKECSDLNVSAPNVKTIPIPGVLEASGSEDDSSSLFVRPISYISINHDEIARAMARNTPLYDMDSEDEDWMDKLNDKLSGEDEEHELLTEDTFELMIDGFEKANFCSPDDYSNEKAASSLSHLGKREVVEAMYEYWMNKRNRKKAPLLRVFQGQHVKKTPLVPNSILRKRRSFKRQASQLFGRGKRPCLLQGPESIADKEDPWQRYSAAVRVEEAKALANRSTEIAMAKRRRAQILMENADLVMYKAMVALAIAEAGSVYESCFDAIYEAFEDEAL